MYRGGAACLQLQLAFCGVLADFGTYTEVLDLVKNLVVECEVIAWNGVNAGILLDLPVSETESLSLSEKLGLGKLATPVCLSCLYISSASMYDGWVENFAHLLQVAQSSHARETENRSARGRDVSNL